MTTRHFRQYRSPGRSHRASGSSFARTSGPDSSSSSLVRPRVEREAEPAGALGHVAFQLPAEPVDDAVHKGEERDVGGDVADAGVAEARDAERVDILALDRARSERELLDVAQHGPVSLGDGGCERSLRISAS